MSKDNQSRIPMRGFSSRIPMPGSSSSQPKSTPVSNKKPNQIVTKVTRPTDIGPLSGFAVTQKISQITKSSLTNLTARIMPRSFSTDKIPPKETASHSSKENTQQIEPSENVRNLTQSVPSKFQPQEDQMLIDETIDLVGSEENVNRLTAADVTVTLSKENLAFNPPNATFDLCRRDGTFIKSPSLAFNVTKTIGSVNSLLDAKETTASKVMPGNSSRAVSKSRDSLNLGNQTRVQMRKSGDLLGSAMSLPKSPEWGSEDTLNMTLNKAAVFNSTMMSNRLVEVSPYHNGFNFSMCSNNRGTPVNVTKMLCLPTADDSSTMVEQPTAMDIDEPYDGPMSDGATGGVIMRFNETPRDDINQQKRFSFGLDITECTLDCSFELIDASLSSTVHFEKSPTGKQGSFDVDESLGILTPDQMKEFLDSTATNHTNNLELQLIPGHKMSYQSRIDQTPSPEELPLDPVGVKTDMIDEIMQTSQLPVPSTSSQQEVSQTESDPKTEMTKSATSKVSNSIITSITSITSSLDTGYIGDGELSRPASRGADQSPSKAPHNIPMNPPNWNPAPPAVHRRNDPMTDSDFFTESDADDVYHQRENQRRAQVIDGQLYGPMLQGANVFIQHQPQGESDSCMESSGIFTDVENRGDDYLLNRLAENRENVHNPNDMSPDISSDTISSSHTAYSQKKLNTATSSPTQHISERQNEFIIETSSSIGSAMNESVDNSNLISDVMLGSTKSSGACEGRNEENSSASSSAITKKATSVKKLIGTGRKSHKNEANLGLKKQELTSRNFGKSRMSSNENSAGGSTKKCLNGRWESVMNKIAENKSVKKKFDNVKSKVTCGVVKRNSTIKTPPSDDHSVVSMESTGAIAKRNITSGPQSKKRGRTFSKDSQQSSQSDLSLNSSSPRATRNVAARSAKKRDVRTINSSPCDLGPPSKTSTNGTNGTPRSNTRTIATITLQKRATTLQTTTAPISSISELKGSPPAKKLVPRRLPATFVAPQEKSPLKDQNRLTGQTINGSPRSSLRSNNSSKPATPPPNNNSNRNATIILDSLSVSPKPKVKELENNNSSKIVNKNNSNASKMQQQMVQQLVDQQTLEKQQHVAELMHANKGVEALGVLVQYLVFNLDAFSSQSLKKEHQKTTKQLIESCHHIDELKQSYTSLEEKLNGRESFFSKRENELQELHQYEIAKAKKSLEDLDNEKREKVESLEQEFTQKQEAAEEKLRILMKEAELKIVARDAEILSAKERENDLLKRIQALTITEDELREKVHTSEIEFSEKLHHANIRERDLTEKINQLTKQLDDMKAKAENEKRELQEKLNLSQDELVITRQTRNSSGNESFLNKSSNLTQSQLLQDEVESLRCVLELKQSEISELRKQNCELQRAADDTFAAQTKCSALESRVEDLQVQLGAKHEEEKELLHKLKQIQDQHDGVQKKSTRLSLHNEELQWRLKQNAERYSHTISELSKSFHEQSSFMCNRSNLTFNELDISTGKSTINEGDDDNDEISPPASPVIKGVVEKSDSVSWVLEMDDETPEVLANRMVRRAGSFRSDKCSPSPVPKRQKCQNNTSIQQSASATSILRQHSEPTPTKTSSTRLRSKSVSANKTDPPKKIVRSASNNGAKNLDIAWKGLTASSPCSNIVPKITNKGDELIIDEDLSKNDFFLDDGAALIGEEVQFNRSRSPNFDTYEMFHRDKAPEFKKSRENRGLITCDTAVLATGEMKKMRRPKIGAGEAMVSGSNSEDEEENSVSTSSTVSTGPSSPSISSSGSSSQQPIESIEDALMRWKSHTPMQVSWCDDGEPSESNV